MFVLSDPRRRLLRPSEGPDERPWWRTALDATYPSTVGLAVLSAISLAFSAILAAVLAGIIGGLGVAGIVVFLLRFSP